MNLVRLILVEARAAVRRLLQHPQRSLLALAVLSCGLASFLMTLSLLDAFVLKPLPVANAERLVALSYARSDNDSNIQQLPAPRMAELRTRLTALERSAAFTAATVNLRDDHGVERYNGALVSGELFGLLGVQPVLGRAFSAEDDRPGAAQTVLLSDAVWRDRFERAPDVLGKAVVVNGRPTTVIGVLPPGFGFPERTQLWVPAQLDPTAPSRDLSLEGLGLLRAGATASDVKRQFDEYFAERARAQPDEVNELQVSVKTLANRYVNKSTRGYLWLMFGTGAFVLLLACFNVANLQLVQAIARERETAVRIALGAGHGRLAMAALLEALWLATAATAIGLWLAQLGVDAVIGRLIAFDEGPGAMFEPHIDGRMLAYAGIAALATALLSGLLPLLRVAGGRFGQRLRDDNRGGNAGFVRFARALVIGEVALSVVLCASAAVTAGMVANLARFDMGIHADSRQILTGRVAVFPEKFPKGSEQVAFFERIATRLRAEPGVEAVSYASILPGDIGGDTDVRLDGQAASEKPALTYTGAVDDAFIATYGVALRSGRFFGPGDTEDAAKVVVVDQRFVDQVLGGKEALGRKVQLDASTPDGPWRTIVGVVEALHIEDIDDPRRPLVLAPIRQAPERYVSFAIRLTGNARAFAPSFARIVQAEDADTPVYWLRTHAEVIDKGMLGEIVLAEIFSAFGILGLLLTGAGLYGVLSFSVAQRTREIGLRRAIGAGTGALIRDVAGRSAVQVGIGLVIGLALGIPWGLLLGHEDPSGTGSSPLAFALVALTIALTAAIATLFPTLRALSVDPQVALRHD